MDMVSHAAWGATIIRKPPYIWWAFFIGALPDILLGLFGLARYGRKYINDFIDQRFITNANDAYIKVYFSLHSFVPITVVAAGIALWRPQYLVLTLPYYAHIVLDIFTHSGIWAIRPLYPLSDWHMEGHDWWKNKWISIGNWLAIVAVNVGIFLVIKQF